MSQKRSPEAGVSPASAKRLDIEQDGDIGIDTSYVSAPSSSQFSLPLVSEDGSLPLASQSSLPVSEDAMSLCEKASSEANSSHVLVNPNNSFDWGLSQSEAFDNNSQYNAVSHCLDLSEPYSYDENCDSDLQRKEDLPDSCDFLKDIMNHTETSKCDSDQLYDTLMSAKETLGTYQIAEIILNDKDLRPEILKSILDSANKQMREALKKSILTSPKKNQREYLLSLTPSVLCEEMKTSSSESFEILLGLLGGVNPDSLSDSQYLKNLLAHMYSIVAKHINRKATGFALHQTSNARDGGMREDTIKLNPNFVHPRTVQNYDKKVLAKNWNENLLTNLSNEADWYLKLENAESELAKKLESSSLADIQEAQKTVSDIEDSLPRQVQCVWDNINLHFNPRFNRKEDGYSSYNKDWMASLWIQERINANHMEHKSGRPLKEPETLSIQDFIPSEAEKNYLFSSLVYRYSECLIRRYPDMFKSLNSSIKVNKEHQFEKEMSCKSNEFSGDLFTKSESNTEDLISMMQELQSKYVHKKEESGVVRCFEKKILSGDNKTEKNSHHGIVRLVKNKPWLSFFFFSFKFSIS